MGGGGGVDAIVKIIGVGILTQDIDQVILVGSFDKSPYQMLAVQELLIIRSAWATPT